jgi:3-methyladenine DNA glycosylase AlkD
MDIDEIIALLKQKSNPVYLAGKKRFGINYDHALGIPIPELRKLAKSIKNDHHLALALWKINLHEARILASMIDDPTLVTEEQIDDWVKDFNSWDIYATRYAVICLTAHLSLLKKLWNLARSKPNLLNAQDLC